jgi:hypothetical protein
VPRVLAAEHEETDGEPALSQLAARLAVQTARLARQEAVLARAGMRASARQAGIGGAMLATGAVLGGSGWLVLLAAAVAGIAVVLPVWAAALIVGGVLALLGGGIAALARRRLGRALPPLQLTAGSVREDLREIGQDLQEVRETAAR